MDAQTKSLVRELISELKRIASALEKMSQQRE